MAIISINYPRWWNEMTGKSKWKCVYKKWVRYTLSRILLRNLTNSASYFVWAIVHFNLSDLKKMNFAIWADVADIIMYANYFVKVLKEFAHWWHTKISSRTFVTITTVLWM